MVSWARFLLAKPQRRKERQQKVPLCGSAAWRETVFRFPAVSVDGVWREGIHRESPGGAIPGVR